MLSRLCIHHLAIVEHLELDFKSGMTVLTGETGAGKSILLDALSLVLGERADVNSIRQGFDVAEVSATFELKHLSFVEAWLVEQGLSAGGECIIRRSIHKDGRSRAYINGYLSPLTQVKSLGERLVDIHGQHQNQSLLKSDYQRLVLDEYAGHTLLLDNVRKDFEQWQALQKEWKALQDLQGQDDKLALLKYQIHEIEALALKVNELESLAVEHRTLTHAESWLALSHQALLLLREESEGSETYGNKDISTAIHQARIPIQQLMAQYPKLSAVDELLNTALIQIEESISELDAFSESIIYDPKRLAEVEERMSAIHAVARKHKMSPEKLLEHLAALKTEAERLSNIERECADVLSKLQTQETHYRNSARLLTESRQAGAGMLSDLVTESLQSLEMPNGRFEVCCLSKSELTFSPNGSDEIHFRVTTNPGHPLQALKKVASGGELSRISLAIQVIAAKKMTIPTLIFDEVDVGISGKTAEIVGKLIRSLSLATQVLCVTHLPQVAVQSHHHFKVEKYQTTESTSTHIVSLNPIQKVQEIARLLGGITITKSALDHAAEMIQNVV